MKISRFPYIASLTIPLLLSCFLRAQDCGCDHMITSDVLQFDGKTEVVMPGDTICVEAGPRRELSFTNLQGTREDPIRIINFGGQVQILSEAGYAIKFDYCEFFHLTGSGEPAYFYGFELDGSGFTGSGGMGLKTQYYSQEFECDHLEIHDIGFAGVMSKTEPVCSIPDLSGFTQYNSSFHDLYIHRTGGEGFYIGYSFPEGRDVTCNGTETLLLPHKLVGLRLYNCIVDSTMWDGIQVGMATEDVEIYNNVVTHFGLDNELYQRSGIQIGGGTSGNFFNNVVMYGPEIAMVCMGAGNNSVYNNVFAHTPDGIYLNDKYLIDGNSFYSFCNNTFVNSGGTSFNAGVPNVDSVSFINNLIINSSDDPLSLSSKIFTSNNLHCQNIAEAFFTDAPGNDFHLSDKSPAIDAGMDLSGQGISCDLDSLYRPAWYAYDAGAYEYGSVPGNQPPLIYAPEGIDLDMNTHVEIELRFEDPNQDSLFVTFQNLPAFVTPSDLENGRITLELVPGSDNIGLFHFSIFVMDEKHASNSQNCMIRVFDPENNNPQLLGPDSVVMTEGTRVDLCIYALDPDGDSLHFYLIDAPAFCSLTRVYPDSVFICIQPGLFDDGIFQMNLVAEDGRWGADSLGIHVTVLNNERPVIDPFNNPEIVAGSDTILEVTARDANGDSIHIYCTSLPSFATCSDHGDGSASLRFQPLDSDVGTYVIKVLAADLLSENSRMMVVSVLEGPTDSTSTLTGRASKDPVLIYPNPVVDGQLSLKLNAGFQHPFRISVNDMNGKCHYLSEKNILPGCSEVRIPVSGLKKGMYLLSLDAGNRNLIVPFVVD